MGSDDITFTVFRGSRSGSVVQSQTTRPPLTSDEVLVSITASGLCGGDLLFKGNDVGLSPYHILRLALNNPSDGSRP